MKYLKIEEVAERMGVSTWTINAAIRRGEIPVIVFGNTRRIPSKWIDEKLREAYAEMPKQAERHEKKVAEKRERRREAEERKKPLPPWMQEHLKERGDG